MIVAGLKGSERMNEGFAGYGLKAPEILLPDERFDYSKWAVIACDQHTAQPEYWEEVKKIAGSEPSTLNIIYPEAWLNQGDGRIEAINSAMREYRSCVLTRRVDGFVLVERQVPQGARLGLLAALDLERYDPAPGSASLIRATEGTIQERVPPRVRIRQGAILESPHVMALADDPGHTLIEPVYAMRGEFEPLYDFDLMLGGGRVRGWKVSEWVHGSMLAALDGLAARAGGLLIAVGDGNHSLAAAKACWETIKEGLDEAARAEHPARYALAEVVNLHDPSLTFEPIHRVLKGEGTNRVIDDFRRWLNRRGMGLSPASVDAMFTFVDESGQHPLQIERLENPLPLYTLQHFLDEWLAENPGAELDYVHGEQAAASLAGGDACVFLMTAIDKAALFEGVRHGGALPRKTFSMGEAHEKRYYLECRALV